MQDEIIIDENDPILKMANKLPFAIDWVNYKGEDVVAQINYERSAKAGKPMMDISYCMTEALHQNILFTTQYDKNKFLHSKLSDNNW